MNRPLRAVLDTNVLVSGLLSPHGPSARLIDLAHGRKIQLLLDDRIFREYQEVLRRPRFGFSPTAIGLLLEFLETEGEHLVANPLQMTGTDPSDQPFLETAISGQADLLVTGNLRHYPRRPFGGLQVVNPRQALRLIMESFPPP